MLIEADSDAMMRMAGSCYEMPVIATQMRESGSRGQQLTVEGVSSKGWKECEHLSDQLGRVALATCPLPSRAEQQHERNMKQGTATARCFENRIV